MRKQRRRKQKRVITYGVGLMVIGLACGIWFYETEYKEAREREKIEEQFERAVSEADWDFFEENVTYRNKALSHSQISHLLGWLKENPDVMTNSVDEMRQERIALKEDRAFAEAKDYYRLVNTGDGKYGFNVYRIDVRGQDVSLSSDFANTSVQIGERESVFLKRANEPLTVTLLPGTYDYVANTKQNGKVYEVTGVIHAGETIEQTLSLSFADQIKETIPDQFGLTKAELIDEEVKAQTGVSLQEVEGLIGEDRAMMERTLGQPIESSDGTARYEQMNVMLEDDVVRVVEVTLAQRPDDLVALIGEPDRKQEDTSETVWVYEDGFWNTLLVFLHLDEKKEFVERDGRMFLRIR